ncbi:GDP-mannose 4,6-dehydratase [bacterium]|nr:GDP-mannose 4,6-dehydratase [bacterium]|tara:strand:+ start:8677 stop:9648 length:972 start_codon:yes stop_codon:yes gene_type:complete
MADLIVKKFPNCKIYASRRWHLSDLSNIENILDKITLIDCDLTDPISTNDLIELTKPEVIFHFAAESFVSPSWKNPHRYMSVNYNGTVNILEAIRKLSPNTIIHIPGSGEEYGDIKETDLPINTNTLINPVNPYAVSKVAQDLIAKVYFDSYSTKVIRTRAFNHEGPRRSFVFGLPWYAYQICRIKKGLQDPIIKTGHRFDKRNFTHVIDMCEAYLKSVQYCNFGDLYLIGNSDKTYEATFDEVLNRMLSISDLSNVEIKTVSKYMRPTQVPFLISDCSKFTEISNWEPNLSLEDILKDTLKYWENNKKLDYNLNSLGDVYPL